MGYEISQIARRCERAVVTAYRDLRQIGSDDMAAFRPAQRFTASTIPRPH